MNEILKSVYLNLRGILLRAIGNCVRQVREAPLQPDSIKRILFIRLDRIGDVVLSTPALRALKQHFHGAELTVLLRSSTRGLVEHNPFVDRIITVDSVGEFIGVIRDLRAGRFDLAVDPYDSWDLEPALLAGLSAAPIRIGYPCAGREAFFNVSPPGPRREAHITDVVTALLEPLGVRAGALMPELFLSENEKEGAADVIETGGLGDRVLIGIHPGASCESQCWPVEYYAELIDLIMNDEGTAVIVFGGPGDVERLQRLRASIRGAMPTFVSGNLRKFAALVRQCRVFVCNNSGPLHVAAALGVPTVSFMGPTVRERWYPRGDGHVVLRIDDLPCIGCNEGTCRIGTHECMRIIRPGRVIEPLVEAGILLPGQHQKWTGYEDSRLHPLPG